VKKYLSGILAATLIITSTVSAFADKASGIKDVEVQQAKTEVVIDVPEYSVAVWLPDIWRGDDFPYKVTIKSNSDKSEYYTIKTYCGPKEYPAIDVAVSAGKSVVREDSIKGLLKGRHMIKIEVLSSDGNVVGSYSHTARILPPVVDAYLEPFTRAMGLAGALAVSEANHVAQLGTHRLEFTWEVGEAEKGKYTKLFAKDLEDAKKTGNKIVALVDYNNRVHNGGRTFNAGVDTKDNIDAFAKYTTFIQDTYKKGYPIEYFEIWNEPNGTWVPRNTTDYTYTSEITKRELMKLDKREKTATGSVAEGDFAFVDETLEAGLYPNMDAVANHPYIRPTLVDVGYHNAIANMTKTITKYGGWKEQIITEIGWATHTAGVTVDQQAIELVKQVVVADYYDIAINQYFRSSDNNFYDYSADGVESNFGVFFKPVENDFKPSAYTISYLNNRTVGAVYCGRLLFDNEDIEASVYARDGELFVIMWSKGEETEVTFEGETLTAADMNGNPLGSGSTFTIGEKPVYLTGISRKHISESLPGNVQKYLDLYVDTCFEGDEDKKGVNEARELIYSTVELAESFKNKTTLPTEEEALSAMREHYSVNKKLIDMYASGELEIGKEALNSLLYVNQWSGNIYASIYMIAVDKGSLNNYDFGGLKKLEEAQKAISDRAGENTLSYSDAILIYAEKFADKVKGVQNKKEYNPLKYGVLKAWDEMTAQLSETVINFSAVEPIGYDNVILQLPSSECEIEIGAAVTINASLYNYRNKKAVEGFVKLVAPDGDIVSQSDSFTLKAGSSMKIPLDVIVTNIQEGTYNLVLVENGEEIVVRKANIKGEKIFDVKIENIDTDFDRIDSVKVKFADLKGRSFSGNITLEPVCNWTLESNEAKQVEVTANGTQEFEWKVTSKESAAYHAYPFHIVVKNDVGETVVDEIQMLSFTVINKTDKELMPSEFNGDISFFYDAYPVYADTPEDPQKEEMWHDGEYYTRMLSKWGPDALYLAFDVFDWYHENAQVGAAIWNGDSIQLGIDPLNNNGGEDTYYMPDDYEYGLALTDSGVKTYAWQDATLLPGDRDSSWANAVRNHGLGMTRYFMRIPKEALVGLGLSRGTTFGFDVCYNNSNVGARSNYVQFTPGVADGKKPYLYWDFTLIEDDCKIENTNIVIPEKIEASAEKGTENKSKFKDIQGHWAEDAINLATRRGYVSGRTDTIFDPNKNVTRCEMAVMLTNVSGGKIEPEGHIYEDVWRGLWHASAVNGALVAGFIPDGMADNYFNPEKNTTREETFAMIDAFYKHLMPGDVEITKSIDSFSDASEVSAIYKDAVERMYSLGIVTGTDKNTLNPQDAVTRAEAVSLLIRVMEKAEEAK